MFGWLKRLLRVEEKSKVDPTLLAQSHDVVNVGKVTVRVTLDDGERHCFDIVGHVVTWKDDGDHIIVTALNAFMDWASACATMNLITVNDGLMVPFHRVKDVKIVSEAEYLVQR